MNDISSDFCNFCIPPAKRSNRSVVQLYNRLIVIIADKINKAFQIQCLNGFQIIQVVPRGFEPRHTESKSVVLPLYYGTKVCKSKGRIKIYQMIFGNCPDANQSRISKQTFFIDFEPDYFQ